MPGSSVDAKVARWGGIKDDPKHSVNWRIAAANAVGSDGMGLVGSGDGRGRVKRVDDAGAYVADAPPDDRNRPGHHERNDEIEVRTMAELGGKAVVGVERAAALTLEIGRQIIEQPRLVEPQIRELSGVA